MRGRKPNEPIVIQVVYKKEVILGKVCSHCQMAKPYERFDRLYRSSDGRQPMCKQCKREENAKRCRAKMR